jgi:hypothetical protein
MILPESIVFTDGNARYAEDGWYLHGYTNSGEHVSVQIRQRDIPSLEYAGRLFFDRHLIALRSATEEAVLALLTVAEVSDELMGGVDYQPGPIIGREGLDRVRRAIINYVQSEEYVEIAKNGVKKKFEPWKRRF